VAGPGRLIVGRLTFDAGRPLTDTSSACRSPPPPGGIAEGWPSGCGPGRPGWGGEALTVRRGGGASRYCCPLDVYSLSQTVSQWTAAGRVIIRTSSGFCVCVRASYVSVGGLSSFTVVVLRCLELGRSAVPLWALPAACEV